MKFVVQILFFFALLFAFQNTSAQEEFKNNINRDVEKMSEALLTGDYELFLE